MGPISILIAFLVAAPGQARPPDPLPPPAATAPAAAPATYGTGVDGRFAVVTPMTRGEARADGGYIDVQNPSPSSLSVAMTGTTAAYLCAGKTSTAVQSFEVAQEFEITCSDAEVRTVDVVLESALVGFVRSKHKAGASARLAELWVTPCVPGAPPVGVVHPPFSASGGDARLCNQHSARVRGSAVPIGRFKLIGRFRLEAEASGLLNGHAVADFSPSTSLPDTWVRARDPFQGVDKKNFGFVTTLTAEAAQDAPPGAAFRVSAVGPPTIAARPASGSPVVRAVSR